MINMKSKKQAKAEARTAYHREFKKGRHSSSTPGKTKVESCQASSLDKFFAKCSRSVRHIGYATWSKNHQAER